MVHEKHKASAHLDRVSIAPLLERSSNDLYRSASSASIVTRILCDRFAIFEHATGRPARWQPHTPEHAGRTFLHRSCRAASSHVSPHPSWTYSVYENPPWPQF